MLQHGAYTQLIDACYDRERFPTEDEAIEWLWASSPEEVAAVKFVLSRFFKLDADGQYVNEDILADILSYHQTANKNRQIAIARETNRRNSSTKRGQDSTKRAQVVTSGADVVHEAPPNQEPSTINQEPKEAPRKRIARPDDVDEQVWIDWLSLRKAKRAPVTQTVVDGARREAVKAGMSLSDFLCVWCRRGSQGLEAAWLRPDERVSFAQQAADVARATVPSKHEKDPALAKIEEDIKKAAPIPENIREKIAALKGGLFQ